MTDGNPSDCLSAVAKCFTLGISNDSRRRSICGREVAKNVGTPGSGSCVAVEVGTVVEHAARVHFHSHIFSTVPEVDAAPKKFCLG